MPKPNQPFDIDASITVGFWSTDLVKESTMESLQWKLKKTILKQIQFGKINFIVTVADEFQILVGEILLRLKSLYPHIRLLVITPYRFGYFSTLLLDLTLIERAKYICNHADVYHSVCWKVQNESHPRIKIFNQHLESYAHLCRDLVLYTGDISYYQPNKIKQLKDHVNIIQISDSILNPIGQLRALVSSKPEENNSRKKLKEFCELIGKRKKGAFLFGNGWTGNIIHHNIWMEAYKLALETEICASTQEGILDYFITLENELQVLAGEAVLKVKQYIPAIRCIVLLPHQDNAFHGMNWSEQLCRRAEKVYNQADIKESFCQSDNSSVLKGFHHFLFTLCSKVIYYIRLDHNIVPYHIICWLGIPKKDIRESVSEALDLIACDILIDSFVDYCMEITNSRLICGLMKLHLQKYTYGVLYDHIKMLYPFPFSDLPAQNRLERNA